jgi:hypothetical protein
MLEFLRRRVKLVFANSFYKLEVSGAKNMKEAKQTMKWLIEEQHKSIENWKYNNIHDPVDAELRRRLIETQEKINEEKITEEQITEKKITKDTEERLFG